MEAGRTGGGRPPRVRIDGKEGTREGVGGRQGMFPSLPPGATAATPGACAVMLEEGARAGVD